MHNYVAICVIIILIIYYIIIQKWKEGWVVISSKKLLSCTLVYYKDEYQWLTPSKSTKHKKMIVCDLLNDVMSVKYMRSSYKSHIMSIMFDHYSILIDFKSETTMKSWITKLNTIKGSYV